LMFDDDATTGGPGSSDYERGELRWLLEQARPRRRMPLSAYANQHGRMIEGGEDVGRWRNLPYQVEMLDACNDPHIPIVVFMTSARVGKTKILSMVMRYHIHWDPASMAFVQPTDGDAKDWSKDEIGPMIELSQDLSSLVRSGKTESTIQLKEYPGGPLRIIGGTSERNFRRYGARVMGFDEASALPPTTKDGDQIELGIKRTEWMHDRKIIIASTPTIKGFCRAEKWYLKSDQRRRYVPCLNCGAMQYLRWAQFKWENRDPETVAYECESCGERIPHEAKFQMLEGGEWRATAPRGRVWVAGFHIWSAYSYAPNSSWPDLVEEFLRKTAENSPEEMKVFVNTTIGETFDLFYANRISIDGLLGRREGTPEWFVPRSAVVLTLGADTQDDRVEASVWAWSPGEEGFLVTHQEFPGDPAIPEGAEGSPWDQMTNLLDQVFVDEDGTDMMIRQGVVDSGGHRTHAVYEYCRQHRDKNIDAGKGSSNVNAQLIGKGTNVDITFKGRTRKNAGKVYSIGTNTAKTTLLGRLKNAETKGPGALHFGEWVTEEFFRGLTCEYLDPKKRAWVCPSGARQEPLDCVVYAYAALNRLLSRYNRATAWDQLARLKAGGGPTESTPEPQAATADDPEARRMAAIMRRRRRG